jgi:hypothetical protein
MVERIDEREITHKTHDREDRSRARYKTDPVSGKLVLMLSDERLNEERDSLTTTKIVTTTKPVPAASGATTATTTTVQTSSTRHTAPTTTTHYTPTKPPSSTQNEQPRSNIIRPQGELKPPADSGAAEQFNILYGKVAATPARPRVPINTPTTRPAASHPERVTAHVTHSYRPTGEQCVAPGPSSTPPPVGHTDRLFRGGASCLRDTAVAAGCGRGVRLALPKYAIRPFCIHVCPPACTHTCVYLYTDTYKSGHYSSIF